jgi:hypothetical protein
MPQPATFLREIVEVCEFVALALTIPPAILVLILGSRPRPLTKSIGGVIAVLLMLSCSLAYAIWTASCVLGGFIEGQAICGFTMRGGFHWDPVDNYWALQIWYAFLFLFSGSITFIFLLWIFPGTATVGQRLTYIFSLSRMGKWH